MGKACKELGTRFTIDEIDVMRGGSKHDLLNKQRQKRLLSRIAAAEFEMVVATPPCGTFSRVRSISNGPPVVRSLEYPWGFPG